MSNKILFVDDDANVLAGCQRTLRKDFTLDTALGGEQGLALIEQHGPYAVVVADMQMPGMNGVQFLTKTEERAPETIRIMLTGNADQQTARDAVNHGHIFRFLTKPCPPEELALTLKAGLRQYALVTAERDLLERTLNGGVKMLTDILSMLDPNSFGQGQRLSEYMRVFGRSYKLTQTWDLELAAMLSPIGFVTMPRALLEKARAGHGLTGAEKDILARAPQIGSELLANIPRLETIARIVLYQNKHHDGTGFPADDVAGDAIPIGARILHVLNDLLAYEAQKMPKFKALARMREAVGKYDPKVLEAVAVGFDVYLADQAAPDATAGVSIAFKDLQVGAVLKADLLTSEGTLMVAAGTEISAMLLEKLRNFAQLSGIKEPILIEKE
jgi:response regulator RpfG family c-di-GMP phosphodiesterase